MAFQVTCDKAVLTEIFPSSKSDRVYYKFVNLSGGGEFSLAFPKTSIPKLEPGQVVNQLVAECKPRLFQGSVSLACVNFTGKA